MTFRKGTVLKLELFMQRLERKLVLSDNTCVPYVPYVSHARLYMSLFQTNIFVLFYLFFGFLRQGFSVALEPVWELTL